MDFDFTPDQQRFRTEARTWLAENVPADLKGRAFASSRADRHEVDRLREWQRTLHKAGYVGLDWPAEYGGRGTSIMEQIILYEEMSRAEAPQPVNRGGISDRKSTRLNSSHRTISYAVFCLKKKKKAKSRGSREAYACISS